MWHEDVVHKLRGEVEAKCQLPVAGGNVGNLLNRQSELVMSCSRVIKNSETLGTS